MNQYVMLGRFDQGQSVDQRRMDQKTLINRIYERTISVPDTRINHVRLTLGRFDVVINAEARSNNVAFDLASEIQAVASEDWNYPATPPEDGGDPTGAREPNPSSPAAGEDHTYAQRRQPPFDTVADARNAPEPGQRDAPGRRRIWPKD